jgi:hypothetical protein
MASSTKVGHARQHADLYILTDQLTPEEVQQRRRRFLHQKGFL